ncbi:MAG: aminoacyl-tRNA hydrolase [Thermoguttaceae bacterium]|nr:aminoacyl-tRNA hydrolase [Thermoguttaceae bacterium]
MLSNPANDPSSQKENAPSTPKSATSLVVPGVIAIPMEAIEISYARSSGPGGQNVNKVSSKARLRWNLVESGLPEETIERFKTLFPSWVAESGDVVIASQISRDAPKNRAACLEKLRLALIKAAFKPKKRIPTKPTRGSILRRLDAKKRLSNKKKERSRRDFE